MPDPRPVVILAPNWLGDAVMALPAIADVRGHFPRSRLIVAARSSVASLYELVPGIDAVIALRWRGRLLDPRALCEDAATIRRFCAPTPGVGILLPNSFAAAWLARRAGLAERWGYATNGRTLLLTRGVPVPRSSMHQARYYQHLTGSLGIASGPLEPRVEVPDTIRDQAAALLRERGWDGHQPFVAMAPGAAYGTAKRWPSRYFAEVVAELARGHGIRSVLVGSTGDADTTAMIARELDGSSVPPIDVAGCTSLHALAGVLSLSAACLSNDSGAMHLAGAIGTPVVAVFGPTRDTETAPLVRANGRQAVLTHPVACRPCMLRECPIDHRCMTGIQPSRVLAVLDSMTDRRAGIAEAIRDRDPGRARA